MDRKEFDGNETDPVFRNGSETTTRSRGPMGRREEEEEEEEEER
jgi:hypothetical protein